MLPQSATTRATSSRQSRPIRYSRICFTVNGTTDQLATAEDGLKTLRPKWIIYGRETCPSTLRKHLQGAIVFGDSRPSLAQIKKLAGLERAHIESMKGTPHDSLIYCSKEDPDCYQYGVSPTPGKRNDLKDCILELKKGRTIKELILDDDVSFSSTYCRYPKGITNISHIIRSTGPKLPPFILWLSGSTGTGKTRAAHDLAQHLGCSDDIWLSNSGLQWFDGYDGNAIALLDDYRTGHCKFPFLLRLLDRYVIDVPIKGGFVRWAPKLIVITAPRSATAMWDYRSDEDLKQLDRRLTTSFSCDGYDTYELMYASLLSSFVELCSCDEYPQLHSLLPTGSIESDGGVGCDDIANMSRDDNGSGEDLAVSLSLEISSTQSYSGGGDEDLSRAQIYLGATSADEESEHSLFLPN